MQSHICATRDKGILVDEIQVGAWFHFLGKKNTFDLLALRKLRNIIRENKIDIVHAHGTSWFLAVLCKILGVKFKFDLIKKAFSYCFDTDTILLAQLKNGLVLKVAATKSEILGKNFPMSAEVCIYPDGFAFVERIK